MSNEHLCVAGKNLRCCPQLGEGVGRPHANSKTSLYFPTIVSVLVYSAPSAHPSIVVFHVALASVFNGTKLRLCERSTLALVRLRLHAEFNTGVLIIKVCHVVSYWFADLPLQIVLTKIDKNNTTLQDMAKYFLTTDTQRINFAKCVQIFKNLSFRGMNNDMISEKFGTSRRSLDRYATGEEDIPLSHLIRVAEVSGVSLAELFGGAKPHSVDVQTTMLETIAHLNELISQKQAEIDAIKGGGGQLRHPICNSCQFGRKTTENIKLHDYN